MPDDRCVPPQDTPPGTMCVLGADKTQDRTFRWRDGGWVVGRHQPLMPPEDMHICGWRFVRCLE
jgi:hypothetical protein